MEQGTSGPKDEQLSTCKFQAEYSCSPIAEPSPGFLQACEWKIVSQTLAELSLPSVGIKYVSLCCMKLNLGCVGTEKSAVFLFQLFLWAASFWHIVFVCICLCGMCLYLPALLFIWFQDPIFCVVCACTWLCVHMHVSACICLEITSGFQIALRVPFAFARNAMTFLTVSLEPV